MFCVRSMTKPLIGAAIWMLIEEGKLSLDDHAARYLYEEEPPPLPQTYQNYASALGVA